MLLTSAKGCRLLTAFALLGVAGTLCLAAARSPLALGLRRRLPAARLAAMLVVPPARDCAGAAVAACRQMHAMCVSQHRIRTSAQVALISRYELTQGSRAAASVQQTAQLNACCWQDHQHVHCGLHRGSWCRVHTSWDRVGIKLRCNVATDAVVTKTWLWSSASSPETRSGGRAAGWCSHAAAGR